MSVHRGMRGALSIRSAIPLAVGLVGLLAAMVSGIAHADDEVGERFETPHFDSAPTIRVERIDTPGVAIPAAAGYRSDLTEVTVQRWTNRGRAEVGLGVGSIGLVNRSTGLLTGQSLDGAGTATATGTVLMLGMRYRATENSSFYADASHVRGLGNGLDGEDRIVSKVGMEFKSAQSNWKIAYGGFGFRLAGDARMTVKLRRSGVTLMMRRAF